MERLVEDIAHKMDSLNLWKKVADYNWAIKPLGTVFPYFCATMLGDGKPVKVHFLLLEGWQTLHDFARMRVDRNFGFVSSPIELPHYELVILENGETKIFRYDTGYMPVEANERQCAFIARLLWEAYGVILRLETDAKLPMSYADEKAVFARIETAPGVWKDGPLEIPAPPPHIETISFDKNEVKKAQDLPFDRDEVLHVDFALWMNAMTMEPRPRCLYQLHGYDPKSKETVFDHCESIMPEMGLKSLWETMPSQLLKALIQFGRVPGEIKVVSGRVFRMLRPLCMELPFKLSLHDHLELGWPTVPRLTKASF